VIAQHIVPRDPDERDRLVVRFEDAEIVEDNVPQRYAKRRAMPFLCDHLLDNVMRHVFDLLNIARLRIAEEQGLELIRLLLRRERKVNRFRERPRWWNSSEFLRGRSSWLMDVVELRQLVRIDRCHPPTRLDDEDDRVVGNMRFVLAIGVGGYDLATIGDLDPRDSFFFGISFAIPVGIVVYNPLRMRVGLICLSIRTTAMWFVPKHRV